MKIAIILVGYNMEEYVAQCLAPWFAARANRLDGNDFVICAVSVPFTGFPNDDKPDATVSLLRAELDAGHIDHLITGTEPMAETEARGAALRWLRDNHCDVSIQVDIDEMYNIDQIEKIFRFVEANPFTVAFKLSFKNYVFDDKTFLVEPFTPMRIHRLFPGHFKAFGFWADNNVYYEGARQAEGVPYIKDVEYATMTIPASVALVSHLTWPNNLRSKKKVEYQIARWGDRCSFRWDDARGLIFNPDLPIPKTASD